jgi:hypothetical protein
MWMFPINEGTRTDLTIGYHSGSGGGPFGYCLWGLGVEDNSSETDSED